MANLMQLEIVTPDKYFIKRDDVVYAGFEALELKTALPTLRLILTLKEPKLPRQELSAESGQ